MNLIKEIIQTIQFYDENYLYDFVSFHFYGLFYDMIINDDLKSDWEWDDQLPIYVSQFGDYTYEQFIEQIKNYILPSQIKMDLGTYKQSHVDFIKYLNIINSFLDTSVLDESGNIKQNRNI